ncbi:SAM-dependent methyltransferase [Pseudomonas allokribbensis]|uniref:SAM-dependent methyltransferase n=1 Tax=Pseudomonas allokribbensis TaxID=2774460 RepID=UPI001787CBBD|nr:SAM-dependent methyltransferase [Pseudomonas allokribbensis]
MTNRGSLVVVGSGISVGHVSEETKGWIEAATKVLYCVADAPTERLIMNLNPNHESLYVYYGEDKPRTETYRQMVAKTLEYVRAGEQVCVVYYGHPGIFVNPGHRAVAIARDEGYQAKMLPAVSSLDCLFCDLGFDPSRGCLIYEATDLVVRKRTLDPTLHTVIWQIACVGDLGYSFAGFDGRNTQRLVDYLLTAYNGDHQVAIYEAAQFAICDPVIKWIRISDLATIKLSGIDTLYAPPEKLAPVYIEELTALGLGSALDNIRMEPVTKDEADNLLCVNQNLRQ